MWLAGNIARGRNRRSVAAAACRRAGPARTPRCRRPAPAVACGRRLRRKSQRVPRAEDCRCIGREAGTKAVHQSELRGFDLALAAFTAQLRYHLVEMKQRSRDPRMRERQQAAMGIGRYAAAIGHLAVADETAAFALGAET